VRGVLIFLLGLGAGIGWHILYLQEHAPQLPIVRVPYAAPERAPAEPIPSARPLPVTPTPVLAPVLRPGFPIPRQAGAYRSYLVRTVRFYWTMAEPPETFFGQVHQESSFKVDAQSAFALGIAQFTPATAQWMQALYPADLKELCGSAQGCPADPKWALRAMVLYDRQLWGAMAFAPDHRERWAFTLAGYNGGAGWIPRERKAAAERALPTDVWFTGVESACLRAAEACQENRGYPRVILNRWAPGYRAWLTTS